MHDNRRYTVGIVDDQPDETALIQYYILDIAVIELLWVESSALQGLKRQEIQPVDILIVDMQMPKLNGVQMVKGLKELPVLIACSNWTEYAYEMSPYQLGYISKSISREAFGILMEKAIGICDEKHKRLSFQSGRITVATHKRDGSKMPIAYGDLVYAEILDKEMSFYFADGSSKRGIITMDALMTLLPRPPFLRVQKSFMINLRYVEEFSYRDIRLQGYTIKVPIGKTFGQEVRTILMGKAPFSPDLD